MDEKLKKLKEEWGRMREIYIDEYGGHSNGVQYGSEGPVDVLLDRMKEIEATFRMLGLNVNNYGN
jgi:hypothetical protein